MPTTVATLSSSTADQSQAEKLLATFDHYIIMDDVEVANLSAQLTAIGITGPKAPEVLRAAGFEISELEPLQFVDVTWRNVAVTVVRGDNASVESYELWLSPDQVTLLRDALVKAGATPVGTRRIWNCCASRRGFRVTGRTFANVICRRKPSSSAQLHFSKGCYIGQEIVERIRSRGNVHRKFTGFEVQGGLPAQAQRFRPTAGT